MWWARPRSLTTGAMVVMTPGVPAHHLLPPKIMLASLRCEYSSVTGVSGPLVSSVSPASPVKVEAAPSPSQARGCT